MNAKSTSAKDVYEHVLVYESVYELIQPILQKIFANSTDKNSKSQWRFAEERDGHKIVTLILDKSILNANQKQYIH